MKKSSFNQILAFSLEHWLHNKKSCCFILCRLTNGLTEWNWIENIGSYAFKIYAHLVVFPFSNFTLHQWVHVSCMCTVNSSVCSINQSVQQGDNDQREVSTADTCLTFSPVLCHTHRHSREGHTTKKQDFRTILRWRKWGNERRKCLFLPLLVQLENCLDIVQCLTLWSA